MTEYHKIQTVWLRDPENNYRTLIERSWATPEFKHLKDAEWVFTEKVDGTNIRVQLSAAAFAGKTDNASIPPFLLKRLGDLFPEPLPDYGDMILYGEGYGAKIQKGGGNYNPGGVDFVLFDAFCGGLWLDRANVEDVASKLGLRVVPEVGRGSLDLAIDCVRQGLFSKWGTFYAEGLVMRPAIELQTRRGERIIAKIKAKDFRP